MLMRTDPFRELDRLTQEFTGTRSRPLGLPMDAYRSGDEFVIHLDLPGVDPDTVELDVERNVLTVHAERVWPGPQDAERIVAERPTGRFSRQLFLGDTLDTDRISASCEAGVLTLRVPVAEQAKPRRISIDSDGSGGARQIAG
ncbi:Hsp20/alpha crystallin family protein [Streptomyces sp. 549]|uniref:Hsp20/alpha crystallin family protein n=1 Tax=Streptomyces sp. 549 TaxID=3049076 RepID=UPI0024C318B2|nr:Hsp20/alpha crystallin family protein [Streptomyces sp. 549]MDK1472394.1 Hsp20/alpha crystallin family protein [Streptomyces sp. 549]